MNDTKKCYITLLIVIISILVSVIIRIPKENEIYNNLDATYHVLLTMKSYENIPVSVHKFLPIVTLEEADRNIPWGACVKDKIGNYYYTSFSSIGFLLPYLFAKIFHLPINIYTLYAFNSLIYIVTLILTIYMFCKLFSKYINNNIIILFTTLIYLFQTEIMHSQGVVYWVQSIFQMLIIIHFLLFLNYEKPKYKLPFFIMCLIMPYVEWTGYISNFAFALIIFLKNIEKNKKINTTTFEIPGLIFVLTVLSFIIFSIHYLLNINLGEYIIALTTRFSDRNITSIQATIVDLLAGYFVSYRYILILLGILLLIVLTLKKYRTTFLNLIKEQKYPLIFFCVIMLENMILLQHAVEYTFDRLKLIYIILMIFFVLIGTIYIGHKENYHINKIIVILLVGISIINMIDYKTGYANYITPNKYGLDNQIMTQYIKSNYNRSNSVLCTNRSVRGYMNLLFDRGIYEFLEYPQAKELTIKQNKQYMIYIIREEELVIQEILIEDLENKTQYIISVENNQIIKTEKEYR